MYFNVQELFLSFEMNFIRWNFYLKILNLFTYSIIQSSGSFVNIWWISFTRHLILLVNQITIIFLILQVGQESQLKKAKLNHLQSLKNNLTNISPTPLKKCNKKTYLNKFKLKSTLILLYYSLSKGIRDILPDLLIKVLKLLLIKLSLNSINQILKNKDQKANKNQDLSSILILT